MTEEEKKARHKFQMKQWRVDNHDRVLELKRKWYKENSEKIIEKSKVYREDNKEVIKEKQKKFRSTEHYKSTKRKHQRTPKDKEMRRKRQIERRSSDPMFKLSQDTRKMIHSSLHKRGYSKRSRSAEILGCTFEDFKLWLESKFEHWMNWGNHGVYTGNPNETWQVDHIVPLSSAISEEDVIRLNHYTNLRPLCSKKNIDRRFDNE